VRVFVVGVGLAHVARQAVHREVHLGQLDGVTGLLGAEHGELACGVLLVALHEGRRLHEHAARAAGRVEDAAVEGLQDLDDQPHDAGGRVEHAALLALLHGEVAEEVLVHLAKGIALQVQRGQQAQQFHQRGVGQQVVAARQHALQLGVVLLHQRHRRGDGLAQVGAFGQRQQVREPGLIGQIQHALGLIVHRLALVRRDALGMKVHACIGERLSAYRRKMSPKTGVENSDGFRPVLAQSWSAVAQRRLSTATRSDAMESLLVFDLYRSG
jgi:hypothetical protein